VTDRQTDRQTDGRTDRHNYDSQDRASIAASRGKNEMIPQIKQVLTLSTFILVHTWARMFNDESVYQV